VRIAALTAAPYQSCSNRRTANAGQVLALPDAGGDTDPATDPEETVTTGAKRKAKGPAGSTSKCVPIQLHLAFPNRSQVEAVSRDQPF
jgi:hypothetical protein